jgi:hypothetical protein
MATTMGAGPIDHRANRGQAAFQGKDVAKEHEVPVLHVGGESKPHNLQQTLSHRKGHIDSSLGGGG